MPGRRPAAWSGVNPKASLSSRLKLPDLESKSRASELLYAAASCRALHHASNTANLCVRRSTCLQKQASPRTARTIWGDQTLGREKFVQKSGVRVFKTPQYTLGGKKNLAKKNLPNLFFIPFVYVKFGYHIKVRGGAKMTEGTRIAGRK